MKHSIFLKINIIFFISIISLLVIFSLTTYLKETKEHRNIFFKASTILKVINKFNKEEFKEFLNHQNLEIVKYSKTIQLGGILITPDKKNFPINKDDLIKQNYIRYYKDSNIKALLYDDELYYDVRTCNNENFLIKDNEYGKSKLDYLQYLYFAILLILILIYFLLINSLNPLKKLQKEIIKFGNGDLNINTKTNSLDEISVVSNEFHNAVTKIKNLKNARELFLRNIMHELKTPITKGKLCISLIEDKENTNILQSVFNRLELLINEMADIERVSSDVTALNKKEYRIIDILDNAIDLLFIDKDIITHNITKEIIYGDFKLLTIVFKNLIDNGIKYSNDFSIEINENKKEINFISIGEEIKDFKELLEPFNKGLHNKNNQKGFGLGLYIVNQILLKHNFNFSYSYKDKKNNFIIYY